MKIPTFFNLMGYTAPDPLDKAKGFKKFLIIAAVNLVLTVAWLYFITKYGFCTFQGFILLGHTFSSLATMTMEVLVNCLVFSPLIILLRKSSTVVVFLIVFIPLILLDLYTQSHFRCDDCDLGQALWYYPDGSLLMKINPPLLRCTLAMALEGVLFGVVALYISRLVAMLAYRKKPYPPKPTPKEYKSFFGQAWAADTVPKPKRDLAFWVLRLLGLGYLVYFFLLVIGLTGAKAWPEGIGHLIETTYANPALAINTYFKISLMVILAFTAAFNKQLRFHACLALLFGHAVSTVFSLVFHFVKALHATESDFLLLSAIIDGVFVLVFLWIALRYKKDAELFAPENDFPINFSVPMTLLRTLYCSLGVLFVAICAAIICIRLFSDGSSGMGAVYGAPDPLISNTVTLYSTLSFLAFLMIKRVKLRIYLFNAMLIPLLFGGIVALLWLIIGGAFSEVVILTRQGNYVQYDWYFVFHATTCLALALLMVSVRRMFYKVDYAVNTLSPSAALCINALSDAFFRGDEKHNAYVLHAIDRYAGGIRGRKRGLLNLPFSIFERLMNLLYGFRPPFSAMSRDEQRYFLYRYFFRNEAACDRAFMPILAHFAYQIGISLNSMVMFAHYSYINVRHEMGYVPFDARDRTQGDQPCYPPPHKAVAALPRDEKDPLNFKPATDPSYLMVAPRVTTPLREDTVPDEVDYLIIGSGAGGATAAYRLACSVEDPSKIMVVERGNRYQPLQDFQDSEIEMMNKIYKEGGLQQTKKFTMTVVQGECVGGSTVVNNAACLTMPDEVRKTWAAEFDINLADIDAEYQKIGDELFIQKLGDGGYNQTVKAKFEQAVDKYNASLPPEDRLVTEYPILVNALNNNGDGNWNLGNKRMRKRSMLETYIPWAESRGVKIVSNMTAVRFTTNASGNKAEYVILRSDNGELKKLRVNKAVIVAAGVISSSHFLMRSGLENLQIGKHTSCNLALPIVVAFEDEIKAYDGEQITMAAADPHGRAVFETYFNCPASFALASMPFFFDKRDEIMLRYKYLLNLGALIGSEPNGVILEKADLMNGQSFTWELGEKDIANMKYAMKTLVQLARQAGATKVVLSTRPGIILDLKNAAEVDTFLQELDKYPLRLKDLFLGTAHPQGGNRMTGKNSAHKDSRVVDEDFRVVGLENVYVADASVFPQSITVNPQWTIMAMSSMAVKKVLKNHA